MSVKIRLSRLGKKNSPSYRIVAVATRSKRDGETLDILGFYNPASNPPMVEIDKEKVKEWRAKGAIATDAVSKILENKYVYTKYDPKAKKEADEALAAQDKEPITETVKEGTKSEAPVEETVEEGKEE